MTARKFPEEGKCRTCRCPCIGATTDLFQDSFKGLTYGEILREKLSVELPNITGASCTICLRCTKLLESVYAFVRQCQLTNELLEQVPAEPSGFEPATKCELEEQKDTSQTTCYLEMDCDEDDEFNGFSNDDDESSDVPKQDATRSDELVVKLEMVQPADAVDSANEEDDQEEEDLVLFASELSTPKRRGQGGRGPAWKDDHLQELLQVAKRFRVADGRIDNTMVHLALRDNPNLARYSREAIKSKLHAVKRMVKQPGMPKVRNRIYERDALELFGGEVES
ncbi:hypothetical protein quinque_002604 [Culex quinquefasciatus]